MGCCLLRPNHAEGLLSAEDEPAAQGPSEGDGPPSGDGSLPPGGEAPTPSVGYASSTLPSTSSGGTTGPEFTLPPFHLTRTTLPGYRFPPPYVSGDPTMHYHDHREMVDPTWEAYPEEE